MAALLSAACVGYGLSGDPDGSAPRADLGPDPGAGHDPDASEAGGVRGQWCPEVDPGGHGIEVVIEHDRGVARTLTDADGRYALTGVPPGRHVLVAVGEALAAQIPVVIPPGEVVELTHPECQDRCEIDVPCVGLAEAIDRGGVDLTYRNDLGAQSIELHNRTSDLDICLDEWMVFFGAATQDALVGPAGATVVPPGARLKFPYGRDVFGDDGDRAWWCIERSQPLVAGSPFTHRGEREPSGLMRLIVDRTDLNHNGIEDHVDVVDSTLQTQHNVWSAQANHPVLVVGRERTVIRIVGPGHRPQVRLLVRNIGQRRGSGVVTEVVPEGFVATDVNPPARVEALGGGATRLIWDVTVEAAVPGIAPHSPTRYDEVALGYRIGRAPQPCDGRCEGFGAEVSWVDAWARPWIADGEPLVIESCAGG